MAERILPVQHGGRESAATASRLERQRKYAEAVQWWLMAAEAQDGKEQHWCESRAALCQRYVAAPLSVPGAVQTGFKNKMGEVEDENQN